MLHTAKLDLQSATEHVLRRVEAQIYNLFLTSRFTEVMDCWLLLYCHVASPVELWFITCILITYICKIFTQALHILGEQKTSVAFVN